MTGITVIAESLLITIPTASTVLTVCWLAGRPDRVAASWADGCAQLAVWRAALPRVTAADAAVWLLALVLRAHGRHRRAGVA